MRAHADFIQIADETGAQLSEQPRIFEVTRLFSASQRELFDYVSDFDRLSEWLWASRRSWADDANAEVPGQVGSVRMIQGPFGPPVREVVKAFDAPRMLAYSANDGAFFGLCTDHLGVVTCEPHPEGGTVFCWQAYGRLPRNPAKAWAGRKLFQVALTSGMKNLERKFPTR